MQSGELASQSTCSRHTDLLAQDGPYRYLKTIPTAWSPQSRTLCKRWITGQMAVDRLDVSSKIEQPSHASDDSREQPDVGKANADAQALPIGQVSHLDSAKRAAASLLAAPGD